MLLLVHPLASLRLHVNMLVVLLFLPVALHAQTVMEPHTETGDFIDYSKLSECISMNRCHFPDLESNIKTFNNLGSGQVLIIHPYSRNEPGVMEHKVKLGKKPAMFHFAISGHPRGNFLASIKIIDENQNQTQILNRVLAGSEGWISDEVDLSMFLGQTITIRLEVIANGWRYEYAGVDYFYVLQGKSSPRSTSRRFKVDSPKASIPLNRAYHVSNRSVNISLWDGGPQADGDEVALYLNDQLLEEIVVHRARYKRKINLKSGQNIVAIKALNEGVTPPNTVALELDNGETIFQTTLNSPKGTKKTIGLFVKPS